MHHCNPAAVDLNVYFPFSYKRYIIRRRKIWRRRWVRWSPVDLPMVWCAASPPCLLTATSDLFLKLKKIGPYLSAHRFGNVSLYSSSSPMARLDCTKSIVIIKTEYSAYQHVQQAVTGMKVSVVVFRGKNRNTFRWLLADKELNPKKIWVLYGLVPLHQACQTSSAHKL